MPYKQRIISIIAIIQLSLVYNLEALLLVSAVCSSAAAAHFKHCLCPASCLAAR